jgi:hypothetical protein
LTQSLLQRTQASLVRQHVCLTSWPWASCSPAGRLPTVASAVAVGEVSVSVGQQPRDLCRRPSVKADRGRTRRLSHTTSPVAPGEARETSRPRPPALASAPETARVRGKRQAAFRNVASYRRFCSGVASGTPDSSEVDFWVPAAVGNGIQRTRRRGFLALRKLSSALCHLRGHPAPRSAPRVGSAVPGSAINLGRRCGSQVCG